MLALDVRCRLIRAKTLGVGSLIACPVDPRIVFGWLLRTSAHVAVALHNHPSGDVTPSDGDRELTARLKQAGELIGIRLVDHVIIGRNSHFSFAAEGLL